MNARGRTWPAEGWLSPDARLHSTHQTANYLAHSDEHGHRLFFRIARRAQLARLPQGHPLLAVPSRDHGHGPDRLRHRRAQPVVRTRARTSWTSMALVPRMLRNH